MTTRRWQSDYMRSATGAISRGVLPALLLAMAAACNATSEPTTQEPADTEPVNLESEANLRLAAVSPATVSGQQPALADLTSEVDTLLLALAQVEDQVALAGVGSLTSALLPIRTATNQVATGSTELELVQSAANIDLNSVDTVSRAAARIPVYVKRIKRALRGANMDRKRNLALYRSLDTLKLAARSVGARLEEAKQEDGISPLAWLPIQERQAFSALNGPLLPGLPFYLLTEGHIDAIDVAYEDDALGITIHDESVDPDVERDPATTILLVKNTAKVQVPDARFAFLGPVGSDVWILPEGQPEAEAAGLLWAGMSTEEIESGVFLNDSVEIRFRNVIGANGLSLFESPQDELSNPLVLVDSENGLPDALPTPVGIHRHANWAFEAPGVYLVRVDARGRLASLPGAPWATAPSAILKFVVLP